MKQICIVFFFCISFASLSAQGRLGIGTMTPHSSAIVDISSTEKGMLIPRMSSAQRGAIGTPATGLLVFDTGTNSVWLYNGSKWKNSAVLPLIADGDGDTWVTTEMNPDDDIIRFFTDGTEYFRMYGGRLETANTGNSIFIGEDAGLNDNLNFNNNTFIGKNAGQQNVSGNANTAVGYHTMKQGTEGYFNAAFGNFALENNLSGQNTAVGSFSMRNSTTGAYNSALGSFSLTNNTEGAENTAIGEEALYLNVSGDYNTALGVAAGFSNTSGTGNVFLGYSAGYFETGGNKLYIENSSANSNNALIYGDFFLNQLRINGALNIWGEYTFPSIDGSAGQVLQTNGSGSVSWQTVSGGGGSADEITDLDYDTRVRVEASPDEDVIHYEIGGTEFFRMDEGRLEVLNTGNSVFVGEGAGANDNLLGNANTFIGKNTGQNNIDGYENTAIGFHALRQNSTGFYNAAFGNGSLELNQSDANTAIGAMVMVNNISGGYNTALGSQSLYTNEEGSENTAIGEEALYFNTDGDLNTALGLGAGFFNTSGSGNVFIGALSGFTETGSNKLYIENSSADFNNALIYGDFSLNQFRINGALNIWGEYTFPSIDGGAGQVLQTNGNGTVSWQTVSGGGGSADEITDADNDTRVRVEASPDEDVIHYEMGGTEFFRMEEGRLEVLNTGQSVFVGEGAGQTDDLSNNQNTFIGYQAGLSNTSGIQNTAIGYQALYYNLSTRDNTALGAFALHYNTGLRNTATGQGSLFDNTGSDNTVTGYAAMTNNGTGAFNAAFGSRALFDNTTGSANVAMGYKALEASEERSNLVAIGDESLKSNGIGATQAFEAARNTAVGSKALKSNTIGYSQTALGFESLFSNTTGFENTAIGRHAMQDNTTGFGNIGIGVVSLGDNIDGDNNTAIGQFAMRQNLSGNENTAIGSSALFGYTDSDFLVAVGAGALAGGSGDHSTAVGYNALNSNLSGLYCTAVGSHAMYVNRGDYCTAVGYSAFSSNNDPSDPYNNAGAFGYDAEPNFHNTIRIGNASVGVIGGFANWSNVSDGRFKMDVQENVAGLDFIMKLRPVTYHLDMDAIAEFIETPDSLRIMESERMKEEEVQIGFIAQEVEAAANDLGFDFHGIDKPKHDKMHYALRYAEFVMPLVKAMQEQQQMIAEMQVTISALQQEVSVLKGSQ